MTYALTIHAAKDLRMEPHSVGEPGSSEVCIALAVGGICGTDLHYFNHGGFGPIRLKEPMILGHEVAGYVETVGANVQRLKVGDLVAVSPSRPCGSCHYCETAQFNHCLNMRFYGSAMPFPHIQGAFRKRLIADEQQCFVIEESVSAAEAAVAEPLSVCLHAMKQAGVVEGARVLITGCGPIGALCVAAARLAGAQEIVVTDLAPEALAIGGKLGADRTINVLAEPDALKSYEADKGYFDIAIEASGSPVAIASALSVLRPHATMVQLGLGGEVAVPMNLVVSKEISLKGSFRFHEEFEDAVSKLNSRQIDVTPLITDIFEASDAVKAFELANDRSKAMKVQLGFG